MDRGSALEDILSNLDQSYHQKIISTLHIFIFKFLPLPQHIYFASNTFPSTHCTLSHLMCPKYLLTSPVIGIPYPYNRIISTTYEFFTTYFQRHHTYHLSEKENIEYRRRKRCKRRDEKEKFGWKERERQIYMCIYRDKKRLEKEAERGARCWGKKAQEQDPSVKPFSRYTVFLISTCDTKRYDMK